MGVLESLGFVVSKRVGTLLSKQAALLTWSCPSVYSCVRLYILHYILSVLTMWMKSYSGQYSDALSAVASYWPIALIMNLLRGADPWGVQDVRTPAPLIKVPFRVFS